LPHRLDHMRPRGCPCLVKAALGYDPEELYDDNAQR
jgi:hypothetical protein